MAKAGDELINPVTRLRTVFRKTARETGCELLRVDWVGSPGWMALEQTVEGDPQTHIGRTRAEPHRHLTVSGDTQQRKGYS